MLLSAALVRANERCDEKERENKTLMARLEHVMAQATMADNQVCSSSSTMEG